MNRIKLEQISQYQDMQCKLFAEHSVDTNIDMYRKRNQFDRRKIESDIYNGKKAEFMVYNYLRKKKYGCSLVDLNIYKSDDKSFDADLKSEGKNLHIKSHVVNNLYPVSWLFQKRDPLVVSPSSEDFMVFCVLSDDENYCYSIPSTKILYEEPKKDELKKTKTCVYESTLLNSVTAK